MKTEQGSRKQRWRSCAKILLVFGVFYGGQVSNFLYLNSRLNHKFYKILFLPDGGGGGGATPDLLFGKVFAENCMKMKKIGLGALIAPPIGSANADLNST